MILVPFKDINFESFSAVFYTFLSILHFISDSFTLQILFLFFTITSATLQQAPIFSPCSSRISEGINLFWISLRISMPAFPLPGKFQIPNGLLPCLLLLLLYFYFLFASFWNLCLQRLLLIFPNFLSFVSNSQMTPKGRFDLRFPFFSNLHRGTWYSIPLFIASIAIPGSFRLRSFDDVIQLKRKWPWLSYVASYFNSCP